MVQLPNIVCMFAMFLMPTRTNLNIFSIGILLCPAGSVVSKNIRLSNPILQSRLKSSDCSCWRKKWEATAFLAFMRLKFISIMPTRNEFCDARNNSTLKATCAHDTGELPICGNPYLDLAHHGFDLHSCDVRFLKTPNASGNTVTGVFNVSGKRFTAAGSTYEELIRFLLASLYRRRAYITGRHEAKREARKRRNGQA